jgi:hypothetical protein
MSSLNNELAGDRRAPGTFDNLEEFHAWRRRNNLGFRPVLRLRPPPPPRPPMPERMSFGGVQHPISVPDPSQSHVWVTNRDSLEGNWHRLNTPITEESVGPTTFRQIGDAGVFKPEHHGINVAGETRMSDDQLRQNLENWNLPTEGDRSELFARNMRVKHHPTFMRNFAEGRGTNEAEISDIVNPNAPIDLREANRLRGLRQEAGYYENVPEVRPQRPMPGANMRTIADLAPSSGGGARAATQGARALPGAAVAEEGALAGGAAAGEMGAMGGAAMMASRAVPILNMVLLGKMLMDGMTASSKETKAKQQELMYRT